MHSHSLDKWKHHHQFEEVNHSSEVKTRIVLVLTAITMIAEIICGNLFGSMALLADGWHMGTHVAAFLIAAYAYQYARSNTHNPQFSFGTGKVSVLGGFASAIALLVVAFMVALESIHRILLPQTIQFDEAIVVAVVGLFINVICAFILKDDHHHSHSHDDDHTHHHHHDDHNLKAAYFHVLADALTSILAIGALLLGKLYGWNLVDPIIGIVGSIVISRWAFLLIKETSPILLDKNNDEEIKSLIQSKIEGEADNRISDLHVWKVGSNNYAAIVSIVTHFPKEIDYYKSLIHDIDDLSHVSIEVHQCVSEPCVSREGAT